MLFPVLVLGMMQSAGEVPVIDRGSTLFHQCQANIRTMDSPNESQNYADAAACTSYIDGLTDGLQFAAQNKFVCVASGSYGTLTRIYVAYMLKHPKLMDEYKGTGMILALEESYPCEKK